MKTKNKSRSSRIPKIRKKETKTKSRLFRFTEKNYNQLGNLSNRYDANVSQVMDMLIEASTVPGFSKFLDKCVESMNSA